MRIAVTCAWCGEEIRTGHEPVSHTICPACAEERFGIRPKTLVDFWLGVDVLLRRANERTATYGEVRSYFYDGVSIAEAIDLVLMDRDLGTPDWDTRGRECG